MSGPPAMTPEQRDAILAHNALKFRGLLDESTLTQLFAIVRAEATREAIEALREPTEAMIDAGCTIAFRSPGPVIFTPSKWMRAQWKAMLECALAAAPAAREEGK